MTQEFTDLARNLFGANYQRATFRAIGPSFGSLATLQRAIRNETITRGNLSMLVTYSRVYRKKLKAVERRARDTVRKH